MTATGRQSDHNLGIIRQTKRLHFSIPHINQVISMANTRNQQRTPSSGSRKRGKKQPVENQIDVDSNTAKEEESSDRVSASEATIGGHSDSPPLKKRRQVIDVLQELVLNSVAISRKLEQVHSEIGEIKKILMEFRSGTLEFLEQVHSEIGEIKKILMECRSGTLESSLLPPPLSPAESTVTTADVAENEGDAQSVKI